MKTSSLLKSIAKGVLNATGIIEGYGPIAAALIPGTKDDKVITAVSDRLDTAGDIIVGVELFGQALGTPGPDKAKAAAPQVFQVLLGLKHVAGKKMRDEGGARAAAARLGSDLADFLNCFED